MGRKHASATVNAQTRRQTTYCNPNVCCKNITVA